LELNKGVIKNNEGVILPVKRVRTPIKARHGVQNLDIIAGREREILYKWDGEIFLGRSQKAIIQEEALDNERVMTLNSPSISKKILFCEEKSLLFK